MNPLRLSELKAGEKGRITSVNEDSPAKLHDMGFLLGSRIVIKRRAPLGDPIHVEIEGYEIALRVEEANWIEVERLTQTGAPQ